MINARTRLGATLLGTTILIAGSGLSGCATEKYVDEHIATVNQRIDEVDRKLSGRIDQSDAAAAAAMKRADEAATAAQTASADAQRANDSLNAVTLTVEHLEQHHAYRTWRDVAHKPPKRSVIPGRPEPLSTTNPTTPQTSPAPEASPPPEASSPTP